MDNKKYIPTPKGISYKKSLALVLTVNFSSSFILEILNFEDIHEVAFPSSSPLSLWTNCFPLS